MKDNKGSVVLYAVFLMMALSATAMITAFVVLAATRFTGNSTRAASAFYAAESGIESSLYKIKDYRDDKNTVSAAIADIDNDNGTLSNDATYIVNAVNDYKTSLEFDLPAYESRQIDIFDPDTGGSLLSSDGTLSFDWDNTVVCDMEVILHEFTSATLISGPTIINYTYSSADSIGLAAGFSYKIKIKALTCDLENVTVAISNLYFPNYIKITSTGEMGTASFPMQAETIWNPPLSGLGEFVLFSESEITK